MKKYSILLLVAAFIGLIETQSIDSSEITNLLDQDLELARKELNELVSSQGLTELEEPEIDESTIKKENDQTFDSNLVADRKYGYDFFTSMPTTITAVGDLPLPNDYKISLKDQFTVILSGSKESIFDLEVKLDGTILFPELGAITPNNLFPRGDQANISFI